MIFGSSSFRGLLTERQFQICARVAEEWTWQEIADDLGISHHMAKHEAYIAAKILRVRGRVGIGVMVARYGEALKIKSEQHA